MKITPEIIKEGLTHCNLTEKVKCDNCPYARIELADDELCSAKLAKDAVALIEKLQKRNRFLTKVISMRAEWRRKENEVFFEKINSCRLSTIASFQSRAKEKFITIDGTFECSEVEELIDETAYELAKGEVCDE